MTPIKRWKRELRRLIYEYPRRNETNLSLDRYHPTSLLEVKVTKIDKPHGKVIDFHNHLGKWLHPDGDWMAPSVSRLLDQMEQTGVEKIVNLDGRWGDELDENVARYDAAHPEKFASFAHLDWTVLSSDNASSSLLSQIHRLKDQGAKGIKIWKDLGMKVKDSSDKFVLISDSRLTDVLIAAGELHLPIMIHTADPQTYFRPFDMRNEKYEQMKREPSLQYYGKGIPSYETLHASLLKAITSAPNTTFIGAHVGGAPNNLQYVAKVLNEHKNYFVDISARIADIGRQPRAFKQLVETHSDRIFFGTDYFPFSVEGLRKYYQFLETDDEYFPYGEGDAPPTHGRWNIYGAHLSQDSLRKIYFENADRIL